MINWLLAQVLQRSGNIEVGRNSRIRWWGLRGCARNRVRIGCNSIVQCRIDFENETGEVRIGDRSYLGASHLVCRSGITIGDDAIISWGVTIVDHDSHSPDWESRRHDVEDWMRGEKDWTRVAVSPVIICDKTWIGFGASILKGVRVGEGAVVGAKAVVTKDVPPYSVVVGNPGRVVRRLREDVV